MKLWLLALMLVARAFAGEGKVELRMVFRDIQKGSPQAFTFHLVNVSSSDLRVPRPSVQCTGSEFGRIVIEVYTPKFPQESGGCVGDRLGPPPPILEEASSWKVLKPGEALNVDAPRSWLLYRDDEAGWYWMQATYEPPKLKETDRAALNAAGIIIPTERAQTPALTFLKTK